MRLLQLDRRDEARDAGHQGLAVARAARSRELVERFLSEVEDGHAAAAQRP